MKAKIQKLSKNSQRIQNSTCIVSNGASTGNLFQNRTSKLIEQKIRVAIELFSIRVFVSETRAGYTHHDVGTTSVRCTPGVRSAFRGHCKTTGGETAFYEADDHILCPHASASPERKTLWAPCGHRRFGWRLLRGKWRSHQFVRRRTQGQSTWMESWFQGAIEDDRRWNYRISHMWSTRFRYCTSQCDDTTVPEVRQSLMAKRLPPVRIQPFNRDPQNWPMFSSDFRNSVHKVLELNADRLMVFWELLSPELRKSMASRAPNQLCFSVERPNWTRTE